MSHPRRLRAKSRGVVKDKRRAYQRAVIVYVPTTIANTAIGIMKSVPVSGTATGGNSVVGDAP
jgi:hypothetical protein